MASSLAEPTRVRGRAAKPGRLASRLLVAWVLLATALVVVSAAGAGYSDTPCRTVAVAWTNDPCAGRQWGLANMKVPQAWAVTKGLGVTVAVVDTGADFGHPDLKANLIAKAGSDLIKNTAYKCPFQKSRGGKNSSAIAQDDHGHGTHVAGIIAAVTGNGVGVAGVARAAKVLPVKVLDAGGSGLDTTVAAGICFAADAGAKVINLSLGFNPAFSLVVTVLGNDTDNAIDYAYSKGAAVIVAAGNESFPACDFPASYTKALCVGSVDRRNVKSWFSNFGSNLGVVAPGGLGSGVFCHHDEDVWSTIWSGSDYDCSADGYDTLAGTSMAAPHVAGAAALIRAKYGAAAKPSFVYAKLEATALDLGPPGVDPLYGYGLIDAYAAVTR